MLDFERSQVLVQGMSKIHILSKAILFSVHIKNDLAKKKDLMTLGFIYVLSKFYTNTIVMKEIPIKIWSLVPNSTTTFCTICI